MPCSYCGDLLSIFRRRERKHPTRDHVWPRSRFVQPVWCASTVPACGECNEEKSGRTLREWLTTMSIADPRYGAVAAVAARHPLPPPTKDYRGAADEFEAKKVWPRSRRKKDWVLADPAEAEEAADESLGGRRHGSSSEGPGADAS
jgi:hypothetical protein